MLGNTTKLKPFYWLVGVSLFINMEVLEIKSGPPRADSVIRKMAAGRSDINTTNHYLITSDTTEKDKNLVI